VDWRGESQEKGIGKKDDMFSDSVDNTWKYPLSQAPISGQLTAKPSCGSSILGGRRPIFPNFATSLAGLGTNNCDL
jgi:hypothetical protein